MHARYYAGAVGRFLSVDPAMDLEKILPQPQLWNRYAYVGNNPLRYTDPDGRERLACWHFNRQPVPDRGFKTGMIETSKTASVVAMMLGIPMPGERLVGNVLGRIGGFALGRFGFSAAERGVIGAATKILKTGGDDLIKAFESGQAKELTIAGQKIIVQPDAPISGTTLYGEKAFVLGKEAFASKQELATTVLHEMCRLTFQSGASASGTSAAASTKAAAVFAEKAFDVIRFAF